MGNREEGSLLGGRSTKPLSDGEIRSVGSTILGFGDEVSFKHDPTGATRFVVEEEEGEEVGRIYYGADVYPGPGVLDPNSALTMKAAVAHELSHFHRWNDRTELPLGEHTPLDEALTSLDAVLRYSSKLSEHEIQQLVRDAVHRLQTHRAELGE